MGNDTDEKRTNPFGRVLLIGGLIAVVAGAVIAGIGRKEGEDADFSAQLVASMIGDPFYREAVGDGAGYAWMWFGIVLAVLGVISVIAYLAARAARS